MEDAMLPGDRRVHLLRLRVGMALVVAFQAFFWAARAVLDAGPVPAIGPRIAVLLVAFGTLAASCVRDAPRLVEVLPTVGGVLLVVAQCWLAVASEMEAGVVLASAILLFSIGAIVGRAHELLIFGVTTVLALAVLGPLYAWPPDAVMARGALLLVAAIAGGTIVSWFRIRTQGLLTREIARRELVEDELRAARARLELILNATSEAILGVQDGPEGAQVTFANRRFGELFALDPRSLVGATEAAVRMATIPSLRSAADWDRGIGCRPAQPDDVVISEFNVARPRQAVIEGWSGPMSEPDGHLVGRLWVLRDVTGQRALGAERERYATRLERTNADLARASRAKDTFLANLSHELRTPLSVIIGYLNLVLEDDLTESEARAFIGRCIASARHQLELISTMLDLTRLEAGTAVLEVRPVAVRAVVDEVRDLTHVLAADKQLTLDVQLAEDLVVLADGGRLKQILLNLVGNALKFTAAGGVTIAACAAGRDVRFTVRDTGRGIPLEAQALLFQKFMQLEAGPRHAEEGVGLGLSICRELVNLMGATLARESAGLGLGTEVRFTLPRAEGDAAAAPLL